MKIKKCNDVVLGLYDYLREFAKYEDVYYPTPFVQMYYCTREEYEQNKDKVKFHYPIIHRYCNTDGWCVNTDWIGKPLTLDLYEYPSELVRDADFPLYLGGGEKALIESPSWRDKIFKYEALLISFSITRKTTHLYHINIEIDDEEIKYFKVKKLLLPPYPVIVKPDWKWCGEMDGEVTRFAFFYHLINLLDEDDECAEEREKIKKIIKKEVM